MITDGYLNSEKDLAKRMFIYYTDKLLSYKVLGSDRYKEWYKKSCILYFLTKGLINIRLEDSKLYSGSEEVDEDFVYKYTANIREFTNYDIREFQYIDLDAVGNIKDIAIIPAPPIIISYSMDSSGTSGGWRYYIITVVTDNATEITLPFNFGEADANSLNLTVNDGDPVFLTSPTSEGFHIINTTLYWHTYYSLKAGDKISIRYLKIA